MLNKKTFIFILCLLILPINIALFSKPNIILIMTDDQGWGQTGYMNHPILKTPHLDAMSDNGLTFKRFYAGGPVCSPTRATVLTGRTHDRTGVFDHGYALRLQEKTISQSLKRAGYVTGHFGKWHLNGLRGPGVPVDKDYPNGPHHFGFDHWVSTTNFFDLNPVLSRNGKFEEFKGDSSEVVVEQALLFISEKAKDRVPFFCVIWYGTPHSPFMSLKNDQDDFMELDENSKGHYAELKAMDRSIGTLRKGLSKLSVQENTLLWFMSDNGGLPKIDPPANSNLRDYKGSLYEGGIRVPSIIEWPKGITTPRSTKYPSGAVDIFPTLSEIVKLPENSSLKPQDGESLVHLFKTDKFNRAKPLIFSSRKRMAVIDNNWKLISFPSKSGKNFELYNLQTDKVEKQNLISENILIFQHLNKYLSAAHLSIEKSVNGYDYPENKVNPQPPRTFWTEIKSYKKHFKQWKLRPEYKSRLQSK
jgi:arylsulfatase A-like enzyme